MSKIIIPHRFWYVLGIFLFINACKDAPQKRYPDAKTVEEEMKTFHLADGFSIKNVAAEPQVAMPVSMAIDEDGITYVVQMIDYPFIADSANGKCSIKVLLDTNDDGKYDSSVLFVGKVPDITNVLPYKKGLLVAAAPHIFYMKDTTGDFVADKIDTLFSGFFTGNSEAQITNLTYGLDNWIYANNHGQAGQVKFLSKPGAEPLSMAGHDFRFRLDKGLFEAESGAGQYGLALNDVNHRFYTQNTTHIQTNPIAWRYLKRHAFLPSYRADKNISDHDLEMFQLTPAPYWRQKRSERRQHQYDSLKLNQTEWADKHFTGCSGGTFYGGDAFPQEYYGSIFTGEVAGNLVHRDELKRTNNDIIYTASRSDKEKDKEFLASTDSWFRPATFYSGPDGNLFLIDMYRQHIETPVSIPEDLKADMDFYAGNDKGRIYLITANGYDASKYKKPALSKVETVGLVELLAHPNAWWRVNAQRLIVERQDKTVVDAVRKLFTTSQDARARLRVLYTLDGLDALTVADVSAALNDAEPGVREHAVVLAERFPSLSNEIIKHIDDSAKYVAFQAVLITGNLPSTQAVPALAHALEKYAADSLFAVAVLTSKPGISTAILPVLEKQGYFIHDNKFKHLYLNNIAFAVGMQDVKSNTAGLMSLVTSSALKDNLDVLKSIASGLAKGIKTAKRTNNSSELTALLKVINTKVNDPDIEKILSSSK